MKHENPENFINLSKEVKVTEKAFEQIQSGAKTVEMRINLRDYASVVVGSVLFFKSEDNESVEVEVVGLRRYLDLDQALAEEDLAKISPGITRDGLKSAAKRQFKPAVVREYGVLVIEFKKIK